MKYLALGPLREVNTWLQYNVNGYKFHTIAYGSNKTTMNSGVCIKGKYFGDVENDYYGLLNDVIELEYHNPSLKRTTLVLLKCEWFDPTKNKGWRVHDKHGFVEINFKRRFTKDEPFILAEQSQQVYFAEYASKKKERLDWRVVYKIRARRMVDSHDLPYQDDEVSARSPGDIDDELNHLRAEDEPDEEIVIHDEEEVACKDTEEPEFESEESDFESKEEDSEDENEENVQYDQMDNSN